MKHLTLIFLLIALLVIVPPAHSQASCTPPQEAQLSAVNVTGQYTAWAVGNVVTWCSTNGIYTSYESTPIDTLFFDAYWLPFNLYWGYSVDGYLFQMNVATGQGYLLSPHGQPSGDPGEGGGGGGYSESQSQALPDTPAENVEVIPSVVSYRYIKPQVVNRLSGAWWQRL